MEIHHIKVQKSARYIIIGDVSTANQVVIILHGYGQSVTRLAHKFSVLDTSNVAYIIPEGLHRFYTSGFSGDVGSSWMTREDRLVDIDDYVGYLNQLADALEIRSKMISVLGFSQGAATACRWVADGNIQPINLILWAGLVPPDLEFQSEGQNDALEPLRSLNLILAHSPTDAFRTEEMWKRQYEVLNHYQLVYTEFEYVGGHRIPIDEFNRLWREINPLP